MTSRIAELESINAVQRSQLDTAQERELQNVREVQRELDRAEFDIQRLKGRLVETGNQREADSAKIIRLEGTLAEAHAQISSREALLKEERNKAEAAVKFLTEQLQHCEGEVSRLKGLLEEEKAKSSELLRHLHQREKEIQEDASERISALKKSINASLVEEYEQKLEIAVRRVRFQYDEQLDKIKRDHMDYEAQQVEREAAKRIHAAEERAELNALRAEIYRLKEVHEAQVEQSLKSRYAILSVESTNPPPPNQTVTASADTSKLEEEVMGILQAQLKAMREQLNQTMIVSTSTESISKPFSLASSRREALGGDHYADILHQPPKPQYSEYTHRFSPEINESTLDPQQTSVYYSFENYLKSRETKRVKFDDSHDPDFSAISDGGFHEGYWRMKYL